MIVAISCDTVPCSPSVNLRFGGTCHLHLQGGQSIEKIPACSRRLGWLWTLKLEVIFSSEFQFTFWLHGATSQNYSCQWNYNLGKRSSIPDVGRALTCCHHVHSGAWARPALFLPNAYCEPCPRRQNRPLTSMPPLHINSMVSISWQTMCIEYRRGYSQNCFQSSMSSEWVKCRFVSHPGAFPERSEEWIVAFPSSFQSLAARRWCKKVYALPPTIANNDTGNSKISIPIYLVLNLTNLGIFSQRASVATYS
jgi:hypothetical protein